MFTPPPSLGFHPPLSAAPDARECLASTLKNRRRGEIYTIDSPTPYFLSPASEMCLVGNGAKEEGQPMRAALQQPWNPSCGPGRTCYRCLIHTPFPNMVPQLTPRHHTAHTCHATSGHWHLPGLCEGQDQKARELMPLGAARHP